MKRVITALVAGLLLGTAGIAGASPTRDFHANDIWCKSASGGVVCIAMDGSRYGVGISDDFVMVYDVKSHHNILVRYH